MKNPLFFNKLNSALIYIIICAGLMGIFSITMAQENPWIRKANMPTGRHSFGADTVNGKIYVIGGRYTDNLLTEYDPAVDSWTTKTPMPTSRMVLAAGAVNGKIYAIGGVAAAFDPALSTVEEYDPATDTWTHKKNMPTTRLGLGVSVVDGKIYAIGGMTSGSNFWSGMRNTVEVYDPVTNTWTTKAPMPTERVWFTTSVVDGKIYAIGGILVTKELLSTVEVYDPVTDTWTTKSPMLTARAGHAAAVVDGIIYVFGGGTHTADPGGYSVVEAYDPATDTWMSKADIPEPRAYSCANVVGGKIYAIGGITTFANPHLSGESTVYEYDPSVDLTTLINHVGLNKCYVTPGSGSICISAKMNDPAGITLYAMIESPDQTCIDSLQLFDDGNHNDENAGDRIYSNTWQAGPEEKLYYVDLKVKQVSGETIIHRMNNMASFTTIGPLTVEDYSFTSSDTIFNPGDNLRIYLTLKNNSPTVTARNIEAKLFSLDTFVTIGTTFSRSFGNIAAGGYSKSGSSYSIEISEECPANTPKSILVEVTSDGYIFWRDTLTILVVSHSTLTEENTFQQSALIQNFPNPFSQFTTFRFALPKSGFVMLRVYDSFGKEVRSLVNKPLNAGEHFVNFNSDNLTDGIYYYRLKTGDMILTGKVLLMR
jgi:N-acetylneuraminic acid mutarotase